VLAIMQESRAQIAVVMDEHGGTAGVITLQDLFDEIIGGFEEEAGAIPDLSWDDTGGLRVRGTVRIEEVGEALGLALEHQDVDTVSGLVLADLERPPAVGDVVLYRGVRFEVFTIDGHGVGTCRVTRESPSASGLPPPLRT
jgi:CBS domain containing-hemolysin-like protein